MGTRIARLLAGPALVVSGSCLAVPFFAPPATALPLPAACPSYGPCADVTVSLNKSTDPPSGTITITLQGPAGPRTFTVTIHSNPTTLGTITTNSSGSGSGTFTIPGNETAGQHTITVSDPQGDTGSATLTVLAAALNTPASTHLPTTGTDAAALAAIGAAAIGGGGVLVLGSRRRRAKTAWTTSK